LRKLLLVVAAAVGAVLVNKRIKDSEAETRLWAEATDKPAN
jgi:hypothetical protein